ncbi:MAG: hypothetical protein AAFO74_15155 [Pseudomonadota bacterium]
MIPVFKAPALGLGVILILSGCNSAAQLSEHALQRASFGRINATPFTDLLEGEKCRDRLEHAVGFTQQSIAVKNGVQVTQDYHCKAERIVSRVNLKNLNGHAMHCMAQTEDNEVGVTVGPYGMAHFEYSFAERASQMCFETS